MKAGTFVMTTLLLLGLAAGGTYLVKPELYEGILPDNMIGKKAPKKVKKKGKKKKNQTIKEAKETTAGVPVAVRQPEEVTEPEIADFEKSPEPEVATVAAEDIGEVPLVIKNVGIVKGEEWVDCTKVREKVGSELAGELEKLTPAEVNKFVRKPKNMLLLAQWVVADAELRSLEEVCKAESNVEQQLSQASVELDKLKSALPEGAKPGASMAWDLKNLKKKVSRLEQEQKSAHRFSQSAADEGGQKLMEQIGGDPEWMANFAFSGECKRPGLALSILKKIYKQHPDMLKNRMVRDIATATALEYAKSGWNQQDAVERANFYINAWKDDRLNAVFDDLPMWQRRMVCGCKGDNDYGSIASLTWALDNFHLPADRYSGACWRCDYRLNNIYGDSIHGPLYYAPFESDLGANREAMTYYVGGVCGSLSHFGAFAALANGVPAMTAGEPGHCAFIVLVGDTWTPAYSLSWERGLHWQVFDQVYTYSSLHSATELYSDKQKKETAASNAWRVLGGVYAARGELEKSAECYEKAATTQPRNWMVWREWRQALEAGKDTPADYWLKLNDTLCKELAPLYPEMAAEHMHKGLADGMAKALDAKQLRKAFSKFWKNVKEMGPDRWRIEQLADKQLALLGDGKASDAACDFYAEVLGATASNKQYAPAILNWGKQLSDKFDEKGKADLMQATLKGIAKGGKMDADDRVKLLGPAILAAEANRDRAAFQSMADMVKSSGYKNKELKMPAIQPFPGKLGSEGGMVWASSTSEWDKPHEHAGLLTPEGGSFHTAKEENPYIVVELPRQIHMTGVVLVTVQGNIQSRHNNMKIQVSENGKDWTDVYQFGPCNDRVMRSDLDGRQPLAKYVRILRAGGPEFFHLNGIYIYGNQAA